MTQTTPFKRGPYPRPASPRPWKVTGEMDRMIVDADGRSVARNMAIRNAELIVEAVNAKQN